MHVQHPIRPVPHVIPYQGSKRLLAPRILATIRDQRFATLYEPFGGSAAITLAAAQRDLADHYVISDTLEPLVGIWQAVLTAPEQLADEYAAIWHEQHAHADHFLQVREQFNQHGGAARLLYLLARSVKNAPRFNATGGYNQSPDKRRTGTKPNTMRTSILAAAELLGTRASARCGAAAEVLARATPDDLVYLDPPWEGTTVGADKRYHQGLQRDDLIALLTDLNERGVPFLLSYDGSLGDKSYGDALPPSLELHHIELDAGRSAQATLTGRTDRTIESLYLSRRLT